MHKQKVFLNLWGKRRWILLLLLSFQQIAWAYTMPLDHAFFEDKHATFSIHTVKTQPFQAYYGSLRKTHEQSVFWIQLRYRIPAGARPPLFLRLESILFDSVCLYQNQNNINQFNQIECIKNTALSQTNDVVPLFRLFSKATTEQQILYLRVQTTGAILIDTEIVTREEAHRKSLFRTMIFGLHFGILACLLVWGVYCIWMGQGWIEIIFTCFQAVTLGMDMIQSGYLPIFYPVLFDIYFVSNCCMLFSIFFVILLNRFFVAQFKILPIQKYALNTLLGLLFVNIILYIGSEQLELVHYSAKLGLVHILIVLWILVTLYQTKEVTTNFVLVYGSLLTLSGLLGLLRFSEMNISVLQLQLFPPLVITSLPLSFFLMYERTVLFNKKNQILKIEAALAHQECASERQQRLQQSAFMAMLTHELKSPLSVVNMVMGSRKIKESGRIGELALSHVKKAIRDMQYLVDQCLDVDKLLDTQIEYVLTQMTITDLIEEILQHVMHAERIVVQDRTQGKMIFSNQLILYVILMNLIDNAFKYSLPDTPIILQISLPESEQENDRIILTISNQIGVAGCPDLNLLFEKYYRASGAQRYCGTGLGLWLSRALAQKLQGDLKCFIQNETIFFQLSHPILPK